MNLAFFYFLSALTLLSAFYVVSSHNLFRGAMGLITLLFSVAGLYLTLDAQFLSAVQITVYVGGIVVLIVFVVLLVSDVTQKSFLESPTWRKAAAAVLCVSLCLAIAIAALSFGFEKADPRSATTGEIGKALLSPQAGGFVLPFELISLVLIAAIVGALSVAKTDKDQEPIEKKS